MQGLRILHLANDEKFIDQAIKAFEREAPGCNELIVFGKKPFKYVKSKAIAASRLKAFSGFATGLPSYDLVIIHSLDPIFFRPIRSLHSSSVMIWFGWGYDYYDIICKENLELLLPETNKNWTELQHRKNINKKIKSAIRKIFTPNKKSIIGMLDIFCPVLPCEYNITKNTANTHEFPRQGFWNYGNLEEDMIKGFENQTVTDINILAGNSASAENNHLDTFSLLSKLNIGNRKIISPLSYGNTQYKDFVITRGETAFGDKFKPLVDFMPIQEYVKTLQSCGFVIMNHLRQQAVGNIVIMLYLGAKVFLNKNCPTFSYLKSKGAVIFSTDDLEALPKMLDELLNSSDVATNRKVLAEIWSKEVSQHKTRELLKLAISIRK